jgi:hypothetical protein
MRGRASPPRRPARSLRPGFQPHGAGVGKRASWVLVRSLFGQTDDIGEEERLTRPLPGGRCDPHGHLPRPHRPIRPAARHEPRGSRLFLARRRGPFADGPCGNIPLERRLGLLPIAARRNRPGRVAALHGTGTGWPAQAAMGGDQDAFARGRAGMDGRHRAGCRRRMGDRRSPGPPPGARPRQRDRIGGRRGFSFARPRPREGPGAGPDGGRSAAPRGFHAPRRGERRRGEETHRPGPGGNRPRARPVRLPRPREPRPSRADPRGGSGQRASLRRFARGGPRPEALFP